MTQSRYHTKYVGSWVIIKIIVDRRLCKTSVVSQHLKERSETTQKLKFGEIIFVILRLLLLSLYFIIFLVIALSHLDG